MIPDPRPPFAGLKQSDPRELFRTLPTPCYVLDETVLEKNAGILAGVAQRTGCRILLAQKSFSCYDLYPLLSAYLAGTEASGLFEARLGAEEMPGREVHVFSAAYREDQFVELLRYADHVVFNSPGQLKRFGPRAKAAGRSVGLRINPEHSTQEGHAIYDPCAPGSRLGTTRTRWDSEMTPELCSLLDGLHFHTLCEQDSDALESTLDAVGAKFGDILPRMKWLNMGGGHHITRPDYDIPRLEHCIRRAQEEWGVLVYLEPGEAVALNAGWLATRVLDVFHSDGLYQVILDTSAACHMPDVLEMPYLPPLYGATDPEEGIHCRLAGPTCLAGDVIGDYGLPAAPAVGDLLLFGDMAIYSICKNNTFNGMPLPDLWVRRKDGTLEQLKQFSYRDFRMRLGSSR